MKNQIALVVERFFQENRIFDEYNEIVNRDDCQRPYIELRKRLFGRGYDLLTCDQLNWCDAAAVLFVNIPSQDDGYRQRAYAAGVPMYAIVNELSAIHTNNRMVSLHEGLKKIFTYQRKLWDEKRYIRLHYAFNVPTQVSGSFARSGLCTIIANNKSLSAENELYSLRRQAIKWFEKNHPDDLDVYGKGWQVRLDPVRTLRSYSIQDLQRVAQNANLNPWLRTGSRSALRMLALEPGWITEKIFDCLFQGCVPVYLGPDEITEYVPENCFVDFRRFRSFKELYEFMREYDERQYEEFLESVNKYVRSEMIRPFTTQFFVETILSHLELGNEST